ncbi:hypothetical protein FRC01_005175 [Tulasnella sp. 417]|nr:hypothetical protein FRC01_005175 [Tulasnella sp. 417]
MEDPPRSSSTTPVPADEMIRLNWSRNSVHNVVISSEDSEIMYEVSTPNGFSSTNRVTTVTKLDKYSGKRTIVGEIAYKFIRSQAEVRFGSEDGEWMLVDEWLKSPKAFSTLPRYLPKRACESELYIK